MFIDLSGSFPADITDFTLHLTHTGFLGVVLRNFPDHTLADRKLFFCKSMSFQLLWNQMFCRNMQLFILRITADLNYFHTVKKWPGDCLQRVSRRHKCHLRQIDRDFQIMITETVVLFTVQHLQKRRKSISLIVCADFINLIQKEQRVLYPGALNTVCNPSRHCTNISFSVPTDFSLITDTAKRNSHIRFFQCFCK